MTRKNQVNKRLMLDVIASVLKPNHIPVNQQSMVAVGTGGRKGTMSCAICTKDEETLLCVFDKGGENKSLFPYFNNEIDGMVSMCDYFLFVEDSNCLYVFSIDLKDTKSGAKKQTIIGKTFASFIVNRIWSTTGKCIIPKTVRYAQIGIKTTCDKQTTKQYEELAYDSDHYLVLPDYHKFYTRRMIDLLIQVP